MDHGGRQNVVRTSVTHLAVASCATFLFLLVNDVICDLSIVLSSKNMHGNMESICEDISSKVSQFGNVFFFSFANLK